MARNRRQKLWKLRHTRNEAFYLLLPWTSCHSPLQVRLNNRRLRKDKRPSIILHRNILLRTFICSFFALPAVQTIFTVVGSENAFFASCLLYLPLANEQIPIVESTGQGRAETFICANSKCIANPQTNLRCTNLIYIDQHHIYLLKKLTN